MMTRDEAVAYIENAGWSQTRLGLGRTRELLRRLGDPQESLRFIHVAGSNGKGSICAMLDSVLRKAGYRTGLYTSPYLERFEELIRVDGREIDGGELAEITERIRVEAEAMEDHPSRFEMLTAAAMLYFRQMQTDIVVLEVGMGGALDSTNAISAPEVAVIANITLEHTEYLGKTIEEIADTKCGIIKPGSHTVCYDGEPAVTQIVRARCEAAGVPMTLAAKSEASVIRQDLTGQIFTWKGRTYHICLAGTHQIYNACAVLEVLEALRGKGWVIPESAVADGLEETRWPARFEIIAREPLVILDGAHNQQCAEALADTLGSLVRGQKAVFLTGILADKNYEKMTEILQPYAECFVCVNPPSPRALPAEALAEGIRERGMKAEAYESLKEALRAALTKADGGVLVMAGSLYLAGEIRKIFRDTYRRWLRSRKIKARNSLTDAERIEKSRLICRAVAETESWNKARRILVYKWTKGEVRLDELEKTGRNQGKELVYPLCVSDTEMVAVLPGDGDDAWKNGYYGILEPDAEKGRIISPADIDLVICPCSSFDSECRRMGMGGGFYDRYLPGCVNADFTAVAFEVQRSYEIPADSHDIPVDCVITEKECYT